MELPDWLRIILLLLSFVSFLPQLWLLYKRKDSAGLSFFYVFVNLVVATECFLRSFGFDFTGQNPGLFVHTPPNVGDSINLAQFAVVWALWLVVFIACLAWRSNPDHGRRITAAIIYLLFLLVAVVPIFFGALAPDKDSGLVVGLLGDVHYVLQAYVGSPLCIAALFAQVRVVICRAKGSGLDALSHAGMVAQGLVFTLLALSWPWRLVFPWADFWDESEGHVWYWVFETVGWFFMVGFVAVDYAIFALGQFLLLFIARRRGLHRGDISEVSAAGEKEPMLES